MIPPTPPKTAVAAFVLATTIAALLTPHLRAFAERRHLFDDPTGSRKIHQRAIPRIGGVAIVAAFYAPILGLLLYETGLGNLFYANMWSAGGLLAGGLAIAALGLYDDVRGAGAGEKFAVQFAVALALYWCGYRIENISLPGGTLELGVGALPLTLLWIVGVMNAMNLIDGLDGLAGGVALCAVLTNLVIACVRGEPIMTLCMAGLAGALIGFLFYNFNPASIFMGDSGSLFLGYILATSSIHTQQKSSAVVSLLVPVVALAFPIADTLLAMGRRALAGRPMFSGDKEHIHHRILRLGLSHRQTVLVLYFACLVLGGVALSVAFAGDAVIAWVLSGLSIAAFWTLRRLGFFHIEGEVFRLRRRNHQLRAAVHAITRKLSGAESLPDVLESAKQFGHAVSAHAIQIEVDGDSFCLAGEGSSTASPSLATTNGHVVSLRARFPLPNDLGHLHVEWADGRKEIDRDHEIAAETLCRNMGHALRRMGDAVQSPWTRPLRAPALIGALIPQRSKPRREPGA